MRYGYVILALVLILVALFQINASKEGRGVAGVAQRGEKQSRGSSTRELAAKSAVSADVPASKSTRLGRDRSRVITTDSGLQYEVFEEGSGDRPGPEDRVVVHYEGSLLDGTVFDSSYERGEPAQLPLNAVIKGWNEGLQLMTAGSKYRFIIPPDLAYGSGGTGELIPGDATLVFEVELISIEQ